MTVGSSFAAPDFVRADATTTYRGVSVRDLESVIVRIADLADRMGLKVAITAAPVLHRHCVVSFTLTVEGDAPLYSSSDEELPQWLALRYSLMQDRLISA